MSSWEQTKLRSHYHFDTLKNDPLYDTATFLGNLAPIWQDELDEIIKQSKSSTWRTRGQADKPRPEEELALEEYDLEKQGYGKDYEISNFTWEVPPVLERISRMFELDDCMSRIHVQMPGQVWNLHLDKLEKWLPEDPSSVVRYMIHLNSWEQGHFWSFGNYSHQGWNAGDVFTFDWLNVPHSTANAGHGPRITLQLTGIRTPGTLEFLRKLRSKSPMKV
jgi:hypothetical protein